METMADQLKTELAQLEAGIKWASTEADAHPDKAELCNAYAAQLEKRKAQVQGQLEREEAALIKRQPPDVNAAPGSPISI